MRRLMAVGALAICAMGGIASARPLPVPLNEIMPRLPPVPDPVRPEQPAGPCALTATVIPLGDVEPAARAKQTPDGIALYGNEPATNAPAEDMPPCPISPN